MNSQLFSVDDSALLPVPVNRGVAVSLWSPDGKFSLPENAAETPGTIDFSPPSNKETFHKLRTKYQIALSKMGKTAVATHSKSTRIRKRQSFAITQMLENVAQINSTPLKITSLDTERLVESMRKSTVKRTSMLPRSTRKGRAKAIRRVSKNIDDIFAEHFAEPEHEVNFLTQPTPHRFSTKPGQRRRVVLLDRSDDDPLAWFVGDSPPNNAASRLFVGTGTATNTPTTAKKSSATPQIRRNSLCSPQPVRTSAGTLVKSHAKSGCKIVLGSAVRQRDDEIMTTSAAKAGARSSIKPSAPNSASRKSFSTNRQSFGNSAASTPVRGAPAATPSSASTPPFYTAAASVRRASIAPPTPTTTPQRKSVTISGSAHKLKHTVATPLTNLRNVVQSHVELSVEKMGAFLQSMRKNDLKSRHAALSVTKTRDCNSAVKSMRKPRPSAVRTLTFPEGDTCLSPAAATVREVTAEERAHRDFVYKAEAESHPTGDESMLMDDVLGIDVQQMLNEYSRDIATGDAVVADSENEFESNVSLQVDDVVRDTADFLMDAQDELVQDAAMDVSCVPEHLDAREVQCDEGYMDVDEEEEEQDQVFNSSFTDDANLVEATCATYEEHPVTAVEPAGQFVHLGNTGYNSDSSTSPQIVRLRYSAGSARRSLSNPRGRLSISTADLGCDISRFGVEPSEQTSPLVFTAPVCKAAALLSAAVRNENANADLIAPVKTISTPRSMGKGPVRIMKSGSKSLLVPQTGSHTPKATLRGADLSDSDSEPNASALSGKRVRPGNAISGNARRKSLASVNVSNLIKKFQSQTEKLQKGCAPATVTTEPIASTVAVNSAEVSAPVTTTECSESELPRLTRSAVKASATKAVLMQSPRRLLKSEVTATEAPRTEQSLRSHQKAKSQQKALKIQEQHEEACVEHSVAAVAAEESESPHVKKSTKKGSRKSTAKKNKISTDVATAEKAVPVVEVPSAVVAGSEASGDDCKENASSASLCNVQSPTPASISKTKLSAVKASVTKILASPVLLASATRAYSLRSATKATTASATTEEDTAPMNTAKVLFADEPDAAPTPAKQVTNKEPALPKSTAKTALGPPERRVLGARTPKSTKKGGAGTYTVAKAQRQERNQKLDSLFGTCEELLNLIDATVL